MLNSKPNNKRYKQGNFIPVNKEKVIKLNREGGVYYRSSLELNFMRILDNNNKIVRWSAETIKIPYQLTHYEKDGDINLKNHIYYPDFYYELMSYNGIVKKVVCEVKPMKDYRMVLDLSEGRLSLPKEGTLKKLKSFEYDMKEANRNHEKWKNMIKWCNMKGYEFIIVTEDHLKKFGI